MCVGSTFLHSKKIFLFRIVKASRVAMHVVDLCSPKLKIQCVQENKLPCKRGRDKCGNCVPGYVARGTQCIGVCLLEVIKKLLQDSLSSQIHIYANAFHTEFSFGRV